MKHYICVEDLKETLNNMEDEYRAEISEKDCMNDDPFSDGIMSAMFSVHQTCNSMPTLTESEICERFAERLKKKFRFGKHIEAVLNSHNFPIIKEQNVPDLIDKTLKEISDSN